jgi:hypothetical protein
MKDAPRSVDALSYVVIDEVHKPRMKVADFRRKLIT